MYQFEKGGGISNCCYDCGFSWYCNKCSFITIYDTIKKITCGKSIMQQLLEPQYGRGKFSCDRDADYWIYLRNFFEKDMKYGKHANVLKGGIVDIETIRKIYNSSDINKIALLYKKHIRTCRNEMTSLENLYENFCTFEIPIIVLDEK